ncbi:Decarboxylase NovR [Pigmentiphaga humi]|uniref:Decarboxylase NovR n=2 Tax=Pigmentiphaga humi TaxID=2478468 RepID=A0A3P4B6X5_9BURK|nr:Decarboxylase NovR [Pigmentiphaga humi]
MEMTVPMAVAVASLRGRCSDAEWQSRVDLAACYRLTELYGLTDLAANHISVRVPGEPDAFLINPHGVLYDEICASSLIKIDHQGNILTMPDFHGATYNVNRAGFLIHGAIHEARPEVACVMHTHTWTGMAVSALECGLLPITQTAMRFADIGYHEFEGVVLDEAEKASLARDLGQASTLILRNHGLLAVGGTVAETFNTMVRLELACKSQLAAMACGTPLHPVNDEVVEATRVEFLPTTRRPFGLMEWPAMLRKLDRIDPSYRL